MQEYEFYLNASDNLCCTVKNNNEETLLENKEATIQLQKLDTSPLKHVQITSRNIIVELACGKITFINYKEVINEEMEDLLHNILPKIRKKIVETQRKKHRKKTIKNIKLAGIRTAIGGIAMISLVGTIHAKKGNKSNAELSTTTLMQEEVNDISSNINENINDITQFSLTHSNPEQKSVTYLNFTEERNSITGEYAYNLYHDLVEKCANTWGISPDIVMAVLTQESAGKEVNLMQIQLFSWEDQILTAYNFSTNAYEKYVLTNHPEKYEGSEVTCITSQNLEDPETNISIACILLQESWKCMNHHIGAGIQCYNFGVGNMQKVLEQTALATGVSVQEILSNQENLDFMEYTSIIDAGDPYYLNHVVQYVGDLDNGIYIHFINDDGEIEHNIVSIIPNSNQLK